MGDLIKIDLTNKTRQEEYNPLSPLKEGKPVTLVIHDKLMFRKRGIENPILIISPLSLYNIEGNGLLFSLPGYGSSIQEIGKFRKTQLYTMGLSAKGAKALIEKLNELFKK